MVDLRKYIDAIEHWFSDKSGTITAFSGGVDSTLVLFLSRKFLGNQAVGCISISPSLKRKDYAFAIDFCEENEIRLEVVETAELKDENYFQNPKNRCYFCKSHLYETLANISRKYPGYMILNGTNKDDLGDYRPGLEAAKENHIRAPLVECGIDKQTVRVLARYFGLPNWEKPASPCLSSRVPYGEKITQHKLNQIERAESLLNRLGFDDVRVRHHGQLASIEVPRDQMSKLHRHFDYLSTEFHTLGFSECRIDEEGLISGKLNRALQTD